jgi:hypothetical protein
MGSPDAALDEDAAAADDEEEEEDAVAPSDPALAEE